MEIIIRMITMLKSDFMEVVSLHIVQINNYIFFFVLFASEMKRT